MYKDAFVVDAIAHAFNFEKSNQVADMQEFLEFFHQAHVSWNPAGTHVGLRAWLQDISPELLAQSLFLESDIDIAVHHHITLYSWFADGMIGQAKNRELARRWPRRFLIYAGVDPTQGIAAATESLRAQVAEIPGIVGLKLYSAQINPWRHTRMDDPRAMFPLFDRVRELGLKSVAVHKAMPIGPVPMNPFQVDDVDGAAFAYPDLNFEIVHGGFAFVEETALAAGRMPNVFVNLENTASMIFSAPALFADMVGKFKREGAIGKLMWSSGAMLTAPQPLIEAFYNFELPPEVLAKYNVGQLTQAERNGILGGNYLRCVGCSAEDLAAGIAGDEFEEQKRANGGLFGPWSHWRRAFPAAEAAVSVR